MNVFLHQFTPKVYTLAFSICRVFRMQLRPCIDMAFVFILACLVLRTEAHIHSDYDQPDPFMDAMELEALFEVLEGLNNGIDWRRLYPHPCSDDPWPGIKCDEELDDGLMHVTRIEYGSTPNSTCTRSASISPSISKLSYLKSLFILNCFVGFNTTIFPGLWKMAPTLQMLSLRGNTALVGSIPDELGGLENLQVLSLAQNGLEGRIPATLGNLSKLQNLDLSYNNLHGEIPSELEGLKSLSILDLNANLLQGHVPESLGNLSSLQKMDLSNNRLKGSIPATFGKLKNLRFLAMSGNQLTGDFPSSLSELSSLQYLIIHDNPMNVQLPDFWGNLANISALRLSNSGYYGTIPPSMGKLMDLSELSLDRNLLNGSIPTELAVLPNIYHLNLSGNLLSGPVPFPADFLSRLGCNLDLSDNSNLCSNGSLPKGARMKTLSKCSNSSGTRAFDYSGRRWFRLLLLIVLCVIPALL